MGKESLIDFARKRRALRDQTAKEIHRYGMQMKELHMLANDLVRDIPELEIRLEKMKKALPEIKTKLASLQITMKSKTELLKKQDRLADLATKREKIYRQLIAICTETGEKV